MFERRATRNKQALATTQGSTAQPGSVRGAFENGLLNSKNPTESASCDVPLVQELVNLKQLHVVRGPENLEQDPWHQITMQIKGVDALVAGFGTPSGGS